MRGSDYKQQVYVGEHLIQMPPLPKDKSKILFVNEKDAYWRRDLLVAMYKPIWWEFIPYHTKMYQDATLRDQDQILTHLNKDDSDYIMRTYEEEVRRRNEGVFMKNGNEIVWLTGDHWFILMYCKTKRPDKLGDYFDYREFQRDDAYLVHHVDMMAYISGLMISKPKKTGITNFRWLMLLNRGTLRKNTNYGAMNIDLDKGAKTFRDHFMYAYNGLPMVWKPLIKSKSETEGKIVFGRQYNNSKRNRIITNDAEEELNTTVMCVPTMPHAFDVDVFEIIWYDEYPKTKTDFGELYRSNNSGTSLQDYLVGKTWMTSYTPEENSPSFFSARELYFDSELKTQRDTKTEQTKTKMICHHIPAYYSWWTSFNKYGKCNEKDAMDKIQAARFQLKDRPKELLAETRKYANDKREAWAAGGVGSVFDNMRLGELIADLEMNPMEADAYVEGRLVWTVEMWELGLKNKRPRGQFCPVKFVPLTEEEKEQGKRGRLRVYQEIPEIHQNVALKQGRDEDGFLLRPKEFSYATGSDPVTHAAASEIIQGSKNAFYTMSMPNERIDSLFGKVSTGIIHLEYYDRPENPNEAYEDLVKQIIWTGSLVAVEGNVVDTSTNLMQEGLGNYMLIRDKETDTITTWKRYMGLPDEADKTYQFIRTTTSGENTIKMIHYFVKLAKNFLYKPEDGAKDYGRTVKSLRLLNQCVNLDTTDTRLSDCFMGWGYCLLAMDVYQALLISDQSDLYGEANFASAIAAIMR